MGHILHPIEIIIEMYDVVFRSQLVKNLLITGLLRRFRHENSHITSVSVNNIKKREGFSGTVYSIHSRYNVELL